MPRLDGDLGRLLLPVLLAITASACVPARAPTVRREPAPETGVEPPLSAVLVRRPARSSGALDGDLAGWAIASRSAHLSACYQAAGADVAGRGVVYVLLDVDARGEVSGVTVGHSDLRSRAFESCLEQALRSAQMPPTQARSLVQAHLIFGASSETEARAMLAAYRARREAAQRSPSLPEHAGRALRGRVQSCYERALRTRPGLRGRVLLSLSLRDDGSVARAALAGDGVGHEIGRCVEGAVRELRFESPEAQALTLVYPVLLEPGH